MILPQTWEYELLWLLKKAELQPPSPKAEPRNGDTRVWLVLPHVLTGSVISLHAGGHWCMAVVRHVQVGHMWPSPNTSTTITLSIHVTIDRFIRACNPVVSWWKLRVALWDFKVMMLDFPGLDHDIIWHYELYFERLVQYQPWSSPAPPQEDRPVHFPQLWRQSKILGVNWYCAGWLHSQADIQQVQWAPELRTM